MEIQRPLVKLFTNSGQCYMYDVNKNTIISLKPSQFQALNTFLKSGIKKDEGDFIEKMTEAGFLSSNRVREIIHPADELLSFYLENKVKMLTFQVTQQCNFRCEYCVYSGGYENRGHTNKKMQMETLTKGVDFLVEHSRDCKEVFIGFYGGEPFLEFDLIRQCIEYAKKKAEGKKIRFSVTTNGSIINDGIVSYLAEQDVSLTISLDGPKEIHDAHRRFAFNNKGTFDEIMKNVRFIQTNYPEYFKKVHINAVIDTKCDFSCINKFFNHYETVRNASLSTSQYSENYSKLDTGIAEDFLIQEQYELFKVYYCKIRKIKTRESSKIMLQEYDALSRLAEQLKPTDGLPEKYHHGGPCVPGVQRLFINADGDLYPCERVSETSDLMRIGHVDTGFDMQKVRRILNIGQISEEKCKNCWAIRFCTLCAASVDTTKEFSAEMKSERCKNVWLAVEERMKDYCTLKELGHPFEEEEFLTPIGE